MANKLSKATTPEELSQFFLERANVGDAEGVADLYAADALLLDPSGQHVLGIDAIRDFYKCLFAEPRVFRGETQPALRVGEIALTSTRFLLPSTSASGETTMLQTATTEVACRQSDGTWLWVIDNPNVLR